MFGNPIWLIKVSVVLIAELAFAKFAIKSSRLIGYILCTVVAIQGIAIFIAAASKARAVGGLPANITLLLMPLLGTACLACIAWLYPRADTVEERITALTAAATTNGSKLIPRRTVARRFIGTYAAPFILCLLWGALRTNWHDLRLVNVLSAVNVFLMALMIAYFPSGLTAAVIHTRDLNGATVAGYIIYSALFFAALIWRKRWQTHLLWLLLVVLLGLNLNGCRTATWDQLNGSP